jgi:hypothetical protein
MNNNFDLKKYIAESRLLNEIEVGVGYNPFELFLKSIIHGIFRDGMDDPTVEQMDDWDSLFKHWDDLGDLYLHTQSDIIQLAKRNHVSQEDLDYILELPQVSKLERG